MSFKYYVKIFSTIVKLKLSRQMIYSANFWIQILVDVAVFLIQLVTFETIYAHVDTINGWNRYHMIFFLGTFMLIDCIGMSGYYLGLASIPYKVRGGLLDMYIVKPISTIFFLSFEEVNLGSLFIAVPSLYMIAYSVENLAIKVTVVKAVGYIILIVMMLLLLYDILLIFRTASFWIVSTEALEGFQAEIENFSFRIPGIALKGVWKVLFYIVIPMGVIATIPTQFFTQHLSLQMWGFVILLCAVFTILSHVLWRFGLKHYSSVCG